MSLFLFTSYCNFVSSLTLILCLDNRTTCSETLTKKHRIFCWKLNLCEKSTGSQFSKLDPREKKCFFVFLFLRISKTYFFTTLMSKIFYARLNNQELSLIYPNNTIWNIEKFWQELRDPHATSWRMNHEKSKIYTALLMFAIN